MTPKEILEAQIHCHLMKFVAEKREDFFNEVMCVFSDMSQAAISKKGKKQVDDFAREFLRRWRKES
jgi:hypothetical protein